MIIGITIVVVAVPEGLPLAVMISLAYSVKRMLEDNNFVKKLSSCEIMGGANNICSDKTGTLTKNQMTWTNIWSGEDYKINNPDGKTDQTDNLAVETFVKSPFTREVLQQSVACNTIGTLADCSATEKAMIKFIIRWGIPDLDEYRKKFMDPEHEVRFLFDSARKRMSTIVDLPSNHSNGTNKRIHIKGASEIILATCSHYLDEGGNRLPLDDQMT